MIRTICLSQFQDAFRHADRTGNFSLQGLEALYEYLEATNEGAYELDVIGLCREFTEYASLEDFHEDYDPDGYPDTCAIEAHTCVIPFGEGASFIIGAL
jgi:hypothetical protein